MTKEAKTQIVIDNYFKSECDVNTSIRKAFEKGFRIGVQKGSVAAEPVKHGHWVVTPYTDYDDTYECSVCGACWTFIEGTPKDNEAFYCPHCGARMDEVEEDD